MKQIIQRSIPFVLVCITILSFGAGMAWAAEDIPILEEADLSTDNPSEAEEDIRMEEENAEEIEIENDSFASQPTEIENDSQIVELTGGDDELSNSINDADDTASLATSNTSAHGCGYEQIDFRGMCESNYNQIKDIFTISSYSSWSDAYGTTVGYWVGKVRGGGDWDYKSTNEYRPSSKIFCSYYDGTYHHITSEYMGNYNYGYTGSYLFSLQILGTGSFVVAKFDISDVHTDWPAIVAGFNAAQLKHNGIQAVAQWLFCNGYHYYFNSSGDISTGWEKIDGKWYYFQPIGDNTGAMQTGWKEINGKWYYFNSSGVMQTEWKEISGKWYYFNPSGVMLTGWQQIGSTYYYFESSGDWSGWIIYEGYHYYRDPSTGEVYTKGWLKYNGYWYLLNTSTGKICTGWQSYNGGYYYLEPSNGIMVTGWLPYGNYWYYLSESGRMYSCQWLNYKGYWYYFKLDGKMAVSTTLTINGTQYTFDSGGRMVT